MKRCISCQDPILGERCTLVVGLVTEACVPVAYVGMDVLLRGGEGVGGHDGIHGALCGAVVQVEDGGEERLLGLCHFSCGLLRHSQTHALAH